ncbi:MAG: hypothetical protein Q9M48_07020 [Rhodobacterales bacterium]|nr:hypothetical protein [Rhodobacterales bacterium]
MDSTTTNKLHNQFTATLKDMASRAKSEATYSATRFLQMLGEKGGVETAKHLLSLPTPSDGFTNMVLAERIDLTLEWVVQDDPWKTLFTDAELKVARGRTGSRGKSKCSS